MKKKYIIAASISILLIISIQFIYSLYLSGPSSSPQTYPSIEAFESDTGLKVYNLYDCEEFIVNDKKILLQDSINKGISISGGMDKQNQMNFSIELGNCNSRYEIRINTPFAQYTENCRIDTIANGTLYQYNSLDGDDEYYIGMYVKKDFYLIVNFKNNNYHLETETIESKMIEYIQAIEEIN